MTAQNIFGAYLYREYADDSSMNAWWQSRNGLTQGYLNWWNAAPLALYTSPSISGALLDWLATAIYGLSRPTLSTSTTKFIAGLNSSAINSRAVNGSTYLSSGSSQIASDDIYKRYLTWWLYRGDGMVMNTQWIKRRVMRFLTGAAGGDIIVGNDTSQPSIAYTSSTITITAQAFQIGVINALQDLLNTNRLLMPFYYSASMVIEYIENITNEAGAIITTESGNELTTEPVGA